MMANNWNPHCPSREAGSVNEGQSRPRWTTAPPFETMLCVWMCWCSRYIAEWKKQVTVCMIWSHFCNVCINMHRKEVWKVIPWNVNRGYLSEIADGITGDFHIYILSFFLSLFEGGDGDGDPCVPVDVGMQPGPKRCHELQVGKREQSVEVILSTPFPHPCRACCFNTHCCWCGDILIDLIIADLTVFDARQVFIN